MPVSAKDRPPTPEEVEHRELVKFIRLVLIVAHNDHLVWGRMLQGQAAIDNMPADDLTPLVDVFRRFKT